MMLMSSMRHRTVLRRDFSFSLRSLSDMKPAFMGSKLEWTRSSQNFFSSPSPSIFTICLELFSIMTLDWLIDISTGIVWGGGVWGGGRGEARCRFSTK